MMLSLLTALLTALAFGQTCPTCTSTPIPYMPVTVDLFGQSHPVEGWGWELDRQHVMDEVGVTSLELFQYTTDDEELWIDLTDIIEAEIASTPGLIIEATLLTTDTSIDHDIDRADVKGMSVKIRRLGEFFHRFYRYDAPTDSYVEVMALRDKLEGTQGNIMSPTDMQWVAFDGDYAAASSVYVFEIDSSSAWAGFNFDDTDTDVIVAAIGTVGLTQASSSPAGVLSHDLEGDEDPNLPTGGQTKAGDKCSRFNQVCIGSDQQTCQEVEAKLTCGEQKKRKPTCSDENLQVAGHISRTVADVELMYAFREAAMSYTAGAQAIQTYYRAGSVADYTVPSELALIVSAAGSGLSAVDRIMNGTATDVIVDASTYNTYTSLVTTLTGRDSTIDPDLAAFQATLNTANGLTRAQFCTQFTGASDCNL